MMLLPVLASLVLAAALDPIELQWHAPPECADAEQVRARIDRMLVADVEGSVRVRGDVTAMSQGGYALVLSIAARDGVHAHSWRAERCDALADATALAVAVALDPVEIARTLVRPVVVPEPAEPVDIAREPAPEPSPQRRAKPRVRVDGYARVQGTVGVLLLPRIDAGGAIAAGLQRGPLRVELDGGFLAPRDASLRMANATVRMLAGTITARGCWMTGRRVSAGVCGLFELAIVRARGRNVQPSTLVHDAWLGLGLGPLVQIPLAPSWQLHLGADALLAVRRPRFAVAPFEDDVAITGIGGVRAFVGIAAGSWGRRRAP